MSPAPPADSPQKVAPAAAHRPPAPWMTRCSVALAAALVIFAAGAVCTGPTAIHSADQRVTASYTADIVTHGRWFLPLDLAARPTTKPLLINWLTAPLLMAGMRGSAAHWLPVLAAALAGVALLGWWGSRLCAGVGAGPRSGDRGLCAVTGSLVAAAAVACVAGQHLLTYVRPDGLMIPLLTASWVLGTLLLQRIAAREDNPADARPIWPLALAFWGCVGLLGLAKFVPMIYPLVYLPLASRVLLGRWRYAWRAGWWWGLPLALAITALWAAPAFAADPDYFRTRLIGKETLGRFTGIEGVYGADYVEAQGPADIILTAWQIPAWFVDRMLPVSVLALVGLLFALPWRRAKHPCIPAVLWLAVTLAVPMLSAGKRGQYVLPALAPAAVLAAIPLIGLIKTYRATGFALAWGVLVAAVVGSAVYTRATHDTHTGDRLNAFAAQVNPVVRNDRVVFVATGYNAFQALLGRNQPHGLTEADWRAADWLIAPTQLAPDMIPTLTSQPLRLGYMGGKGAEPGTLSLFRLNPDNLPPPSDALRQRGRVGPAYEPASEHAPRVE